MLTGDWMERIDRHEAFLECRRMDRPLLGPWRSGYFPAEQFPHGTSTWEVGKSLRPEEVAFAPFAEDYERLNVLQSDESGDFNYVGSAYWGIPWLEAIMGCPVFVAKANCSVKPCLKDIDAVKEIAIALDSNAWFAALLRFTEELVKFSDSRFPVCPPLLRGPGDAAAAMLGDTNYVTGFFDAPEEMRELLNLCAQTRLEIFERLRAILPAWNGIHAAGGYPSVVFSRRAVAYHQEDSAAVLSPKIFREFLLPALKIGLRAAEVNFIHLHSACLYPVDILLEDGSFDVMQINIDHRGMGPPVSKLVDTFRKIQSARKPLLLWGEFDSEEWELIQNTLSPAGLSLQPFVQCADLTTSER